MYDGEVLGDGLTQRDVTSGPRFTTRHILIATHLAAGREGEREREEVCQLRRGTQPELAASSLPGMY